MTMKRLRRVCKTFLLLASVVQRADNALHWINRSPVDNAVSFVNSYPLDSDLSVGQRYPPFEELDSDVLCFFKVRMVRQ